MITKLPAVVEAQVELVILAAAVGFIDPVVVLNGDKLVDLIPKMYL